MPSFFKKPSWAINQTGEPNGDFYRRSNQTYKDIIAANREAHQKPNAARADALLEDGGRQPKRHRLSDENEKEGPRDVMDSSTTIHATHGDEHESTNTKELSAPPSDCTPEKADFIGQHGPQTVEPLDLPGTDHQFARNSLDANRLTNSANPRELSAPPLDYSTAQHEPQRMEPLGLPGSDHQSAGNGLNANGLTNSPAFKPRDQESGSEVSESPRDSSQGRVATPIPSQSSRSSNLPADDPAVQILITSEIANTKPLLVHRRMSQRLGDVRLAWCQRQIFSKETQSSVYLTWKGRRLFDVTTCRSLGVRATSARAALPGTEDDDDFTNQSELRIHMEAVTDQPPAPSRRSSSPESNRTSPPSLACKTEEQDQPLKIILRSLGLDDFRIKARPKTLVSRLISAFRARQNIPVEQDVILLFDGDRLDPDTCLSDHDIADQDMIDVQIRNCT